jgi:8-oxo-dGTP pyrophosphatase MutT (NUDIX family)
VLGRDTQPAGEGEVSRPETLTTACRVSFIDALASYARRWPDQHTTVERFRALAAGWPDCLFRRMLPGHLTASAWVVDPSRRDVLLTHHRKLGTWVQLGGHADGDPDLPAVARRETLEESGVEDLLAVSGLTGNGTPGEEEEWTIFDLDIHQIPPYGSVPTHLHYDVRFAFIAPQRIVPRVSEESHDVRWVSIADLSRYTVEESMVRMAHRWLSSEAIRG